MPNLSKSNIALLVDYENVAKPARESLDALIAQAEREGKVVLRRAYANWGRFESHKNQLRSAGFEMIDVASVNGKNSVDIKLVVDAMDIAFSKEHIDTFVIASGDSDFIPLVVKLNELNRRAWLHVPHAPVSPALDKFCFRMPGNTSASLGKTAKIGPTIPKNSPVASAAIAKDKSGPLQNNLSISLAAGQLATIQTALQICDLVIQPPMPVHWLVCIIRALDPRFDQASWLGGGKRPIVRLGKYLQQLGYIDFALDQQKKVYLFSCQPKLRLIPSQLYDHPKFDAAVESLTAKVKRGRVTRFRLGPDFDPRALAMSHAVPANGLDSSLDASLDASLDGPRLVEVDQRVVAAELDETPVQLMFSL